MAVHESTQSQIERTRMARRRVPAAYDNIISP